MDCAKCTALQTVQMHRSAEQQVYVLSQAQDASATSRLANAEQQHLTLQAQLTAAKAAAQAAAAAAAEEADRVPALEHQLRRRDAKLAAADSQMSSLQSRLTDANRDLAVSTSAQARLESELTFSNSELVKAHAAAQQQALQLPDSDHRDRLQQQRDAEMRAVRAEAEHSRLKSELSSSQSAMASLQVKMDTAEVERQQQQATWRAGTTETQMQAAAEKDALQRR